MHEVGLVAELIKTVEQEASRVAAGKRIVRVTIGIGEFTCASPESLQFAFEMLSPGTVVEGAELTVERSPLTCYCPTCDEHMEIPEVFGPCPKCGSEDIKIEGQSDIFLQSIEVED